MSSNRETAIEMANNNNFIGASEYYLVEGDSGVSLGRCETVAELAEAIEQALDNGCDGYVTAG